MNNLAEELVSVFDSLLTDHFGAALNDNAIADLILQISSVWQTLSVDSLTEILAEYGLDDLTYDDVFAFHEDLNDKITFSDLEE